MLLSNKKKRNFLYKEILLLFITLLFLNFFNGCIEEPQKEEKIDTRKAVEDYMENIFTSNYTEAINMLINNNGNGVTDNDIIMNIKQDLMYVYRLPLKDYINYYKIEQGSVIENNEYGNEIINYNVSYKVRYDGIIRFVNIPIIIYENQIGVLWEDTEDIHLRLKLFPIYPANDDLSLEVSVKKNTYPVNINSILVNITLRNERYFSVFVSVNSIAFGYHLNNLNGTRFMIPITPIIGDIGRSLSIVVKPHSQISVKKDIAKMNWHYSEKEENEKSDIQYYNYSRSFNFEVTGNYIFQASHVCYNNPLNYPQSNIFSNKINLKIE